MADNMIEIILMQHSDMICLSKGPRVRGGNDFEKNKVCSPKD